MRVRVWDPFYEIIQLQDRTNRLLRDGFGRTSMAEASMPAVDVYEDEGNLVVEAALPNFNRKDIDASLTEDGLEIKAEHSTEREDKKRNYLVRETSGQSFYRFINLPANARTDQARASFEDGVLRVEVPLESKAEQTKLTIAGKSSDQKPESK
jgi:HSP20 family protein